ncbi:hypothetical protein KR044_003088 [Drosophila immigrans]|nr:hypothetical protein KR044_003088 [Drosophila immigrans]
MGPTLMENMRNQAERFGADLRMEDVVRVELDGDIKKVFTDDEEFHARTVILVTGAAPRYLGVPGEEKLLGHGVSACATCDGFFFKDRQIAVAEPSTATSVPGVFAAGDLVDSRYQQAVTAAGSGCRAALDAEAYLAALDA